MVEWICFDFDFMPTVFYTTWLSCDGAQFWGQVAFYFHWLHVFLTFYVRRALQQKQQHQCIIYCMSCRSLLSEKVDKFQSEIRIPNVCKSNSNFKTEVRKFELRLTSLLLGVVRPSVCLSVCLSVCPSVCPSVCLWSQSLWLSGLHMIIMIMTLCIQ